MKIVKATRHGGSIIIPLTGMVEEGEQYLVQKKGNQIIIIPMDDVVKNLVEEK
jgi:hypothetical protein